LSVSFSRLLKQINISKDKNDFFSVGLF